MYRADDLLAEAREALDKLWFLQGLQEVERTDRTISLRLYIRKDVFVQAFLGELLLLAKISELNWSKSKEKR